ncbi:TPA: type 1 fimbrial protein [Escherichia coli]|uniref:Fimbrial protein n=1 Tax=Escherichia coli TaxID=562 RepID=A0A1V2GCE4_ECOLX|nr:fimbrial protein [Escherichia coli]EFE7140347.1 fimbrial protein [Escherichia coli]EFG3744778.1 type 1 fimbrial protein [Escherichia coli]EFG3866655.1 type 1 fimbrial protein [Escherichia coli]EFH1509690.1 type 1 fimbrial protein [Escherichia coli]EHL6037358.1 type 1 fimbrial protein [Escherichia coli]
MSKVAKTVAAGLLALFAGSASATDGKIEFTGEILGTVCEFANGDTVYVELGHYAANQFKFKGDKSPTIPFTIPLKNCPTVAWDHIDGTKDASFQLWLETRNGATTGDNNELVAVTSMDPDTAATGVGIRIEKDAQTPMAINKLSVPKISFPITGSTMNLDLAAYYVSTTTADKIKPGEANATVDVTLDYR